MPRSARTSSPISNNSARTARRRSSPGDGTATGSTPGAVPRGSVRQGARSLRDVGGDRVHQRRRQAIIGLKAKLLQSAADRAHPVRADARFDHRGDERGEFRGGPALLLEPFGMDEVEPIEWMALVLDAAIHVNAAFLAGVAMDGRTRI